MKKSRMSLAVGVAVATLALPLVAQAATVDELSAQLEAMQSQMVEMQKELKVLREKDTKRGEVVVVETDYGDLQEEVMVTDLNRFDLLLTRVTAPLPQLDKLVMEHDLGEGAPQGFRLAGTQDPGRGRIDELNLATLISNQNPIRHVVEHGCQAAPLLGQRRHLRPKLIGHMIEGPDELADFVAGVGGKARAEIPFGHPFSGLRQPAQRSTRALGDD